MIDKITALYYQNNDPLAWSCFKDISEGERFMVEFQKYKTRGAYHWEQVYGDFRKKNLFVLGRYMNVISLLKRGLTDLHQKRILDLGCGDGVLSYLLMKEGAIVTGIDYSEQAIEYAKARTVDSGITYCQGSVDSLPFEDASFDAVVSSDVIEHLDNLPAYFREIQRVCVSGACVVISTPVKFTEFPLDKEHVIEWFPKEFQDMILQQFHKSEFFYSHPLALMELYNYIFAKRLWFRMLLNLYSNIFPNPFEGFTTKFRYTALQFSLSYV